MARILPFFFFPPISFPHCKLQVRGPFRWERREPVDQHLITQASFSLSWGNSFILVIWKEETMAEVLCDSRS